MIIDDEEVVFTFSARASNTIYIYGAVAGAIRLQMLYIYAGGGPGAIR